MKELDKNNKSFEIIKHIDRSGIEFWYARELQSVLNYIVQRSEELAANLFRIAQTESKLKRDKTDTEKKACDTYKKCDIFDIMQKHLI